MVLVKVVFPSLDCTKIFRLNPNNVNYEPLIKFLTTIAKVDEDEQREFRLFTATGQVVHPGASLLPPESSLRDKDILMFKREDGRITDSAGVRRKSTALLTPPSLPSPEADSRKYSLSSSMGDMRPTSNLTATTCSSTVLSGHTLGSNGSNNGTHLVASSDYWSTVSTFIGNFLKRRPPVIDLPRHVLEMMDAPLVPKSHVIVACVNYLRDREAYTVEGIFRLSGLATEVQLVCESFKQETFDLDWIRNVHTVATALKQYCRTSSIIPSHVCTPWAHEMRASRDDGEVLNSIVKGISSLPTENRFILSCLFSFLQLVLDNNDTNKMAAHSLSVVWGPNLIHFHIPALDAFSEANIQATTMYIMLTHLDALRLLD